MIQTWSRGVADDGMAEAILVELQEVIRRHPWWQARARLTIALLEQQGVHPPARVLDAGCGWGVTLERLEHQRYQVDGLDVSRQALERLDREGRTLIEADLTRDVPNHVQPYDAVLALDVIEHLDDDQGALARLAKLVAPGGILIVSVPALPDLFSEFDAIQGHRRRYTPETLRAAFEGTGLEIESIRWWCGMMVNVLRRQRTRPRSRPGEPPEATYRRYLKVPPWPISSALRMAFAIENQRTRQGFGIKGTSLIALARRPGPKKASNERHSRL
ncbi:MAG: class I SAM-dependent methyltransferase [Isosphaeraceae bacterium]